MSGSIVKYCILWNRSKWSDHRPPRKRMCAQPAQPYTGGEYAARQASPTRASHYAWHTWPSLRIENAVWVFFWSGHVRRGRGIRRILPLRQSHFIFGCTCLAIYELKVVDSSKFGPTARLLVLRNISENLVVSIPQQIHNQHSVPNRNVLICIILWQSEFGKEYSSRFN